MNTSGKSFFDQFLNDFYAECEEHLTSSRNIMLSIEATGTDRSVPANVLDELLRNFHSLKGLSAMVGLEEVTQLSHHIEEYLKELKHPDTIISAEGIDRVVTGIDSIEQVIEAKRKSRPMPDTGIALLHLQAAAEEARVKPQSAAKVDDNVWRFVFKPSAELAARGVTVNTVREQLRQCGEVLTASPQVLGDGQIAFEFTVSAKVPESAFQQLCPEGVEYSRISGGTLLAAGAESHPTAERETGKAVTHNFIRVEMGRLDDLMRIAGELVVSRFQLDEVLRAVTDKSEEWDAVREINLSLERQLRELREKVVRSRMISINQVFERMRFVIRGLERELDKAVDLYIDGKDTEIDKVVVERILDPLLHIVRNAIGHGLESGKERVALGKPPKGRIQLSAKTVGDVVVIEVSDDGRGIDTASVAQRARALGWMSQSESLDPKRLLEIISAPGFTTRDEADLTSGRGIGMAAVKAAISELGGSIHLETAEGKGTHFSIRLPLTLLITDALMVKVGSHRFAVPQTSIQEVVAVDSSAVRAMERNDIVPFRGSVLPLISLARLFGIEVAKQERLHVLVIANGGTPAGLAVDRIMEQREIVVRGTRDPLLRVPGIVGATELGDGKPILILDPHSLLWQARRMKAAAETS